MARKPKKTTPKHTKEKPLANQPSLTFLRLKEEIRHQVEWRVSAFRDKIPPFPRIEKNIKSICEQIAKPLATLVPAALYQKKTGGKRKKGSSPLESLSPKTTLGEVSNLAGKLLLNSVKTLTEKLQHSLNIPSRREFQKLNDQLTQLDQRISQLQDVEEAPAKRRASTANHRSNAEPRI